MVHQTEQVFAALGDPSRRAIVEALSRGERSASSLAGDLPMTLQGALKHLRLLEEAGVVSRRKEGRTTICRLEPEALAAGEEWLHRTRMFWTGQLGALARHLEEDDT